LAIALPAADGVLDPRTLFAKPVDDIWLEIGFGNGEHLLAQAQSHPHIGFLGCEPFLNGVAALIAGLHRHQLDNVRIFADDVRGLLAALPDASIGRMFVLFSDPWPKRRHHRRRVITVETAPALARVLKDGASLWFASDHCGYVQAALQTLSGSDDFRWTAQAPDDWRRRPVELFPTRYESKALARGASCVYLRFERMKRV
jgi:tRNA (guanine-N7-)-methyltransferase